jgi:putative DNA primase/helicase
LRTIDAAIRRRLFLIPFTVTIAPERQDKQLTEKLKPEWSGILRWAVDGCLEWQRIGLTPPP